MTARHGKPIPSIPENFWSRVAFGADCWNWAGNRTPLGYGRVMHQHRSYYAHRMAYQDRVGPIPDGFVLDHLCRNRSCVNPAHLEVVTSGENTRRGEAGKPYCKRGHLLPSRNKRGKRPCRPCMNAWAREKDARLALARHVGATPTTPQGIAGRDGGG